MIDSRTAPYAALLLRVSLGVLFLAHAGLKFFVFTPAGTAKFFDSVVSPAFTGTDGIVYILPEVRSIEQVFLHPGGGTPPTGRAAIAR